MNGGLGPLAGRWKLGPCWKRCWAAGCGSNGRLLDGPRPARFSEGCGCCGPPGLPALCCNTCLACWAGGPGKTSPEDENRDEENSWRSFRSASADTSTAAAMNQAETTDNFMLDLSRNWLELEWVIPFRVGWLKVSRQLKILSQDHRLIYSSPATVPIKLTAQVHLPRFQVFVRSLPQAILSRTVVNASYCLSSFKKRLPRLPALTSK